MQRVIPVLAAVALAGGLSQEARAQAAPYNPYAVSQEVLEPVGPDGTIRWGTFYKSAAVQQTYERLWSMGACRGTNKAITVPVAENKLVIDRLPEADFTGVVRGASGGLSGGMVAFVEPSQGGAGSAPLVAQFHPAGVTRFAVSGTATPAIVRPGMTVRLTAMVDARGRGTDPVRMLEIISPPQRSRHVPVLADKAGVIVGVVSQVRPTLLGVRVEAGRIRRLTIPLAADAVVSIDAASLDLVSPGDSIEVKGRLWTGEGAMGAGTVFASDVVVHKATGAQPKAGDAAAAARPAG